MNFDLSIPTQLMQALTPDIVLMAGAMVLMLVSAWKPDSDEHQRLVGRIADRVARAPERRADR